MTLSHASRQLDLTKSSSTRGLLHQDVDDQIYTLLRRLSAHDLANLSGTWFTRGLDLLAERSPRPRGSLHCPDDPSKSVGPRSRTLILLVPMTPRCG